MLRNGVYPIVKVVLGPIASLCILWIRDFVAYYIALPEDLLHLIIGPCLMSQNGSSMNEGAGGST